MKLATWALSLVQVLAEVCPNDFSTGRILLQSQVRSDHKLETDEVTNTVQHLAAKLPAGDTRDLFQSFSICGSCQKWQRFGEANDGGYLSCMDNLKNGSVLAAYSMGIANRDQWSEDVFKKFHVPVYQYDCTVSEAQDCDQCHFFQACLGSKGSDQFPGKTTWTLKEALQKSKMQDVPDRSLLLKMDIEGGEWPTLLDSHLTTLKKFRQLIIEFHHLKKESKHLKYVKVMRHLREAGFHVLHVHGNNCCGMYEKDGLKVPNTVEVTFDAFAPELETCQDPTRLDLDMKNQKENPDLDVPRTQSA